MTISSVAFQRRRKRDLSTTFVFFLPGGKGERKEVGGSLSTFHFGTHSAREEWWSAWEKTDALPPLPIQLAWCEAPGAAAPSSCPPHRRWRISPTLSSSASDPSSSKKKRRIRGTTKIFSALEGLHYLPYPFKKIPFHPCRSEQCRVSLLKKNCAEFRCNLEKRETYFCKHLKKPGGEQVRLLRGVGGENKKRDCS